MCGHSLSGCHRYESRGGVVHWDVLGEQSAQTSQNDAVAAVNRSPHRHCADYFNAEREQWVRTHDSQVFSVFEFDSCCRPAGNLASEAPATATATATAAAAAAAAADSSAAIQQQDTQPIVPPKQWLLS